MLFFQLINRRYERASTVLTSNKGFEEHNLLFVLVESDSTVWEIERRLAPGERRTVMLDFEPGEYKAVCNFSGHEDRGMFTGFVVSERTPNEVGSARYVGSVPLWGSPPPLPTGRPRISSGLAGPPSKRRTDPSLAWSCSRRSMMPSRSMM